MNQLKIHKSEIQKLEKFEMAVGKPVAAQRLIVNSCRVRKPPARHEPTRGKKCRQLRAFRTMAANPRSNALISNPNILHAPAPIGRPRQLQAGEVVDLQASVIASVAGFRHHGYQGTSTEVSKTDDVGMCTDLDEGASPPMLGLRESPPGPRRHFVRITVVAPS